MQSENDPIEPQNDPIEPQRDPIEPQNDLNEPQNEPVQPFDPFKILYKIMGWAGYYKLLNKPRNKSIQVLHYIYRFIVVVFVIIYNVQHILYFVTLFSVNRDESFEGLMFEIPQFNLITKLMAVNIGMAKLERLKELMHEPIFAARSKRDEELLRENHETFRRLTSRILIGVSCSGIIWTLSAIFTRVKDKSAVVPIYVPFSTDTWTGFGVTILMEHGPVCWTGLGHISLDILIGCYYSQATVQLKIIRHNLEDICSSDKVAGYADKDKRIYKYIDDLDGNVKARFAHYVERYGKVIWFVNEATAVFNVAITVQFLTTSSTICLVIYKLSLVQPGTLAFLFLVVYFFILQLQVVLYCYFGELLSDESKNVVNSACASDWLSLSPRTRRLFLIALARWNNPLAPKAAGVVPLSLKTFMTLVRAAFNLFTVLKTTNETGTKY